MLDIKTLASGSDGNCYSISDGKSSLLLECGIPIKAIKRGTGFRLTRHAACLLTHEHDDHAHSAKEIAAHGVPLHCTTGTAEALGLKGYGVHATPPGSAGRAGSFQFTSFSTQHDAAQPCGYLIRSRATGERLLFVTDSFYIHQRFRDLNYIMVECNHITEYLPLKENPAQASRLLRSHMSLATCIRFLKSQDLHQVKRIYLLHISRERGDPYRMKYEVQRATGKEVEIALDPRRKSN